MNKQELLQHISSLDKQKFLLVYDENCNFAFGVYYVSDWYLMFTEFYNVSLTDIETVERNLNMFNDNFIYVEVNKDQFYYTVRQEILKNVIKNLVTGKDANLTQLLTENMMGRYVKILKDKQGIVVNLISSLSDYYYGIVLSDGTFMYTSCVGKLDLLDDDEVAPELKELRNDYNRLSNIRLENIYVNDYMDIELIFY